MEEIQEDEQLVTQQPFKSKEVGCQNSMVHISNSRLQTLWKEEGGITYVTLLESGAADQTSSSYLYT